jgi:hypothetical protein
MKDKESFIRRIKQDLRLGGDRQRAASQQHFFKEPVARVLARD